MPPNTQPANETQTRIPTRTRRQAMDWSLVLLTQGIEATIHNSETEAWSLLVNSDQYATAVEVIRQYRTENLRWPWRQKVLQPGVLFDWGSLLWVVLLLGFFWLSTSRPALREVGLMDARQVSNGQWWRLFTSVFLHADLGHLATNAAIGFVLLGLVMGGYGTGVGLLAAYFAGAGGNSATWLIYSDGHRSLGASGMVTGCLGLLAVQSFAMRGQVMETRRHIVAGIAGGLMLFLLLGLAPGTDVLAHIGGFATGIFLGGILVAAPRISEQAGVNVIAGVVFGGLVVWTWWLALLAIH